MVGFAVWWMIGCGPDLPSGWEDAQPVDDLAQGACYGDPFEDHDERIRSELAADPLQVDYLEAYFRCAQDVEAFWLQVGDRVDVLVQPIDMNPRQVAKCDCLYDIDIDVAILDAPPGSVALFRRSDNINDNNDPVQIGVVDGTTDCGALAPSECASHAACQPIDARPMQEDGTGGACVDFSMASEDVGCMEAGLGCDDVETVAVAPDDGSWWFPSSCIPAGWTVTSNAADEC